MNKINPKIYTSLLIFVLLISSPVVLADKNELLKRFGLPETATLEDVEKRYSECTGKYKKGSLHHIYYTNLYKKIVREFSTDIEGLRNKLSGLKIGESSKKGRPKKRLFLGEGSFSFAVAFLLKHPEMAPYIVATEYDSIEKLREKHGKDFERNYRFLQSLNMDVRFGVDATKLDKVFTERFKRIHFNFPYYGKKSKEVHTKNKDNWGLIKDFFLSVKELQQTGDRVYIALPKPPDPWERKRRQGLVYAIYSACTKAGYQYVTKRPFIKEEREKSVVQKRYPGYEHVMTSHNGSAKITDNSREYIFEKTDLLVPPLDLEEVNDLIGRLRSFDITEKFDEAIKSAGLHKNIVDKLLKILNSQETLTARIRNIIDYIDRIINKVDKSKKYDKNKIIKRYSSLRAKIEEITQEINRSRDEIVEKHKFILNLVKDLASYGLESTSGFNSKMFFAKDVPNSLKDLKEVSIQYIKDDNEEKKISIEDALDFLFSEKLVIYYNTYKEIYNSAFYPLPELDTDSESSDYGYDSDSDGNGNTDIDFEALESKLENLSLEQTKKESLKIAQDLGKIGPRTIDGWILQDVEGDGNCLYRAFAHQLQLIHHSFISEVPKRTDIHDSLRLQVQQNRFEDQSWANHYDIVMLARKLNLVIAIIDTRYPESGFIYHYIDQNGNANFTQDIDSIDIHNRSIIKLAFTGNHYLSVIEDNIDATTDRSFNMLRTNFQLSREFNERYLEENRHFDSRMQRGYDLRFGLDLFVSLYK